MNHVPIPDTGTLFPSHGHRSKIVGEDVNNIPSNTNREEANVEQTAVFLVVTLYIHNKEIIFECAYRGLCDK